MMRHKRCCTHLLDVPLCLAMAKKTDAELPGVVQDLEKIIKSGSLARKLFIHKHSIMVYQKLRVAMDANVKVVMEGEVNDGNVTLSKLKLIEDIEEYWQEPKRKREVCLTFRGVPIKVKAPSE
eukprot:4030866-Lingulodinium_polyedra.AAC.1